MVLGAKDIQQVLDHYTFVKNLPVIQKESFITEPEELDLFDFSEVKDQQAAKHVLEIATAGKHNVLISCSINPEETMDCTPRNILVKF